MFPSYSRIANLLRTVEFSPNVPLSASAYLWISLCFAVYCLLWGFRFACFSNIISELFLFRCPTISDTEYFEGICINMYTWSSTHSASIISIPFLLRNIPIIRPISASTSLSITYLRYFGANTIWYMHSHFVWAKLLFSLDIRVCTVQKRLHQKCDASWYTDRIWRAENPWTSPPVFAHSLLPFWVLGGDTKKDSRPFSCIRHKAPALSGN